MWRLSLLVLLALAVLTARAELTFDGTIGNPALHAPQSGDMTITEGMGTRNGANLFHSFATFGVDAGESAAFTHVNSAIRNIVARVTGLDPSSIDGNLSADASLWLLNPNGILVGADAEIDVAGTLALGSADFVRLEDGTLFDMNTPVTGSTLLIADPADFGFAASSTAGNVALTGFQFDQDDQIIDEDGAEIVIAGGSVTLDQTFLATYSDARAAGELRIVAGTGDVAVTSSRLAARTKESNTSIPSTNSAGPIDVRAPNGTVTLTQTNIESTNFAQNGAAGRVRIVGGQIVAVGSSFDSAAPGTSGSFARGADVELDADAGVQLFDTTIVSVSQTRGGGGNVTVSGSDVTILLGTIRSNQESDPDNDVGDGGDITITGTNRLELSETFVDTSLTDSGEAGDIVLHGGDVFMDRSTLQSRNTFGDSNAPLAATAENGAILIDGDSLTISDHLPDDPFGTGTIGSIVSTTNGRPAAGDVTIDVTGALVLTNLAVIESGARAFADQFGSAGAAGDITLRAGSIDVIDAFVTNSTLGNGLVAYEPTSDGCCVPVDPFTIVPVPAASMTLESPGTITIVRSELSSRTLGATDAGNITILGNAVALDDGATIRTDSGAGGLAGTITIEGTSSITSNVDTDGTPQLGNALVLVLTGGSHPSGITLSSPHIDLAKFQLDASTSDFGFVGPVTPGQILIDATGGDARLRRTFLASVTGSYGDAGSITILGDRITLDDDVQINTGTFSSGNAGSITIIGSERVAANVDAQGATLPGATMTRIESSNPLSQDAPVDAATAGQAGSVRIEGGEVHLGNTLVSTSTRSSRAGNAPAGIVMDARDGALSLSNSTVTSTTTADNDAGSVTLRGRTIALTDNALLNASTFGGGDAGNIDAAATERFSMLGSSIVNASSDDLNAQPSQLGSAGTVTIRAADVDLASTLVSTATDSDRTDTTRASVSIEATDTLHTTLTTLELTTTGAADAGDLTLRGGALTLGPSTSVLAVSDSSGDAGGITIEGTSLHASESQLSATARASGSAGDIVVRGAAGTAMTGPVTLDGGSSIESSTTGSGDAGNVSIATADAFTLDDASIRTESAATGAAGTIALSAASLTATDADIAANTTSNDPADAPANVMVSVDGGLELVRSSISSGTTGAASAGEITIDAAQMSLLESSVSASTSATGSAGTISLSGADLVLEDSDVASVTTGSGDAGSVLVLADEVSLDGSSVRTSSAGGSGNAGSILIEGTRIGLANLSQIVASTASNDVAAGGEVRLDAISIALADSTVSATTEGAAAAGSLDVVAGELTAERASLTVSSDGAGDAGSIRVAAQTATLVDSLVASTGSSTGDAGSVSVQVDGALTLDRSALRTLTTGDGRSGMLAVTSATLDATGSEVSAATSGNSGAPGADLSIVTQGAARLADTTVAVSTSGSDDAGKLTIASETLSVQKGTLTASTTGAGNAGNVALTAETIAIGGASDLASTTSGAGDAGTVSIAASDTITLDSSSVRTLSTSDGNAGTIALSGAAFAASNAEVSATTAGSDPSATPSDLTLTFDGAVTLAESTLSSSTSGAAGAGGISVDAASFHQSGGTVEASTTGAGNAGNIAVHTTGDVHLTDNASIQTSTSSTGAAGSITIAAEGDVLLETPNVPSNVAGDAIQLAAVDDLPITGISSQSSSGDTAAGGAGSITIGGRTIVLDNARVVADAAGGSNATQAANVSLVSNDSIALTNGAQVRADTGGGARGGEVVLLAPGAVSLAGAETRISSSTAGAGDGGNVHIGSMLAPVTSLALDDAATISADTTGTGAGGQVNVFVRDDLVLSGPGTGISSNATDAGDGGLVSIVAGNLFLEDAARIESTATGAGDSGSIRLDIAGDLFLTSDAPREFAGQSAILTSSTRSSGGDIFADVGGELRVIASRIESSVATDAGQGGDVNVTTASLFMQRGQILARADQGNGGAIRIARVPGTDGSFLIDAESIINADSAAGVSGEVSIDSPDTDVNSTVSPPEARITRDVTLTADICSPAALQRRSSFVVMNQGGVAPAPDGYYPGLPPTESGTALADNTTAPPAPPAGFVPSGGCR